MCILKFDVYDLVIPACKYTTKCMHTGLMANNARESRVL